jgi:hypothetical protein
MPNAARALSTEGPVPDGLQRARAALARAEAGLAALEAIAGQLARPLLLSRAYEVWKRLEVAGSSPGGRGPGLFERLRAARARVDSARAWVRAAEADEAESRWPR